MASSLLPLSPEAVDSALTKVGPECLAPTPVGPEQSAPTAARSDEIDAEQPELCRLRPGVSCCIESNTTLNNGYLGSRNDEERSEMRYLV